MARNKADSKTSETSGKHHVAVFAAGCFWGVEHTFSNTNGVVDTEVGFAGGYHKKPTYEDVCTGRTGHAESVKVVFDPSVISYGELLDIFWKCHDPATGDHQSKDIPSQYRSIIFYINDEQKQIAEHSKKHIHEHLQKQGKSVTTQVVKLDLNEGFHPAEEYHQDYVKKQKNKNKP